MKVSYTLESSTDEVAWHSGSRDGKIVQSPIDAELQRVGARKLFCGELNGKELNVAVNTDGKLVAALLAGKFVSREWLISFERQFGKQLA